MIWDELIVPQDFIYVGSFYLQAGLTDFGLDGATGTVDHILTPMCLLDRVRGCLIPWKAARRLQLIPDARPRDHVPTILERTAYQRRAPSQTTRQRWNRDRIALALQEGSNRLEFQ
eukprot:7573197-Pyramimonas_sp.AAC.1